MLGKCGIRLPLLSLLLVCLMTTPVAAQYELHLPLLEHHPPFCITILTACRLTTSRADEQTPAWSPNGFQIAFARFDVGFNPDNGIYVMNVDGSDLHRIHDRGSHPAWSPDRNSIAFRSEQDGNAEIYVMSADGSQVANLTRTENQDERDFAWSPDGSKIVYEVTDRPDPCCDFDPDIYVMNADGSQHTRLASNAFLDKGSVWSPDSNRIVYGVFEGGTMIYVINADGSNSINLSALSIPGSSPSWSPSGEQIAFAGNGDIYIMNSDGSELTNLTNDTAADSNPLWSPDGSKLIFQSQADTEFVYVGATPPPPSPPYEIYVIDANGNNRTQLSFDSPTDTFDHEPTWSPDSKGVAFVSRRGPGIGNELFLIRVENVVR